MSSVSDASGLPVAESRNESLYTAAFWLAYLANVLLVAANSLTFRFAEFVSALGGTEILSGQIISAGLLAALLCRFGLGQAMDRQGTRPIWLASAGVFIVSAALFPLLRELSPPGAPSPLIWGARVLFQVGVAGMFSCSIVHIQNSAPPHRRTEVIGSLGTSGFVGQILGTQCGDLIFNLFPGSPIRFEAMFYGAALLGAVHFATVLLLTRRDVHDRPERTPAAHRLLWRYWPGPVLLVAMAMGSNIAVNTVFLTRYATLLGLHGIGLFFLGFAVTAFVCRWVFRDWAGTAGRHSMVLWGLGGLALGQSLLIVVRTDWMLLPPAMLCGFGHALLFPAVVSLGAGTFPVQYRGTGTTLVLGAMDLGTIMAAPLLGALIDAGSRRAPGTPLGFVMMSAAAGSFAAIVWLVYRLTAARVPDTDSLRPAVVASGRIERPSAALTEPALTEPALTEPALAGPAGGAAAGGNAAGACRAMRSPE